MERNKGVPDAKYCGCGGGTGVGREHSNMWYPAKRVNGQLVNLSGRKMTKDNAIKEANRILGVE